MKAISLMSHIVFILFSFLWTMSAHAEDSHNRKPSSSPVFASERFKLKNIAVDSYNLVPKSFSVSQKSGSYPKFQRIRAQTENVVAPQSMRKNFLYN